ncbi:peptide chain release factor N(5)-glutamine methyltransferase [Vallitalea maricola]|uniref:Peptide chain release factor N(5)-glutamine methyltransferase n=1 Tax=Vallitalea maricola TaxID=3074433 RepID=A0ACB5UN01_9FIRM|nr:peptide chain release factor N(5)-glutamine methyltransferase [Vallitalea sp. AN17-2]
MKKTIRNALDDGIKTLSSNNITDARLDADLLLEHVLGVDKVYIIINGNELIAEEKYNIYNNYIAQRAEGKPLQYIIGYQEFMGLTFKVNENVLIPRQDTEVLVLEAIKYIKENNITNILEIGTGTGCIPISICYNCNDVKATTVDISDEALKIAKENAIINNVADRIQFVRSNLFEDIDENHDFQLFISNPPYIRSNDIGDLMIEVKEHEPIGALDGGEDGLYFYREISKEVKNRTKKRSYILYEVGYDQSDEVKKILNALGYTDIKIYKDLTGINRVVAGAYNK